MGGMSNTEMGKRLRYARKKAGYETLADFIKTKGVTPSTYRSHEQGERGFTYERAKIYASLLGCDPDWLYTGRTELINITAQPIKYAIVAGGRTVALEKVTEFPSPETRTAPAISVIGKTPLLITANLTITAKPGWVAYTEEPIKKGIEKLYGLPCWVETEDGETLVCEILKGYTDGKHNLMCYDSSFRADVSIRSAAKIYGLFPLK